MDPGDTAGYVEALTRLRDDPALRARMGRYNRDKAMREYDYDTVVGELCEIYGRISESTDASEGTVGMSMTRSSESWSGKELDHVRR